VVCSNQQITEHLRYLMKYADDTYVIIPACNVYGRQMDHIGEWAERNSLILLNRSKSAEIFFTDSRKRRSVVPPSPLPDIARVQSLKVLGVTISSSLSLSEHVNSDEVNCWVQLTRFVQCRPDQLLNFIHSYSGPLSDRWRNPMWNVIQRCRGD